MSQGSDLMSRLLWAMSLEPGTSTPGHLRAQLSGAQPEESAVLAALQELQEQGLVRQAARGRWSMTEAGRRRLQAAPGDTPAREPRLTRRHGAVPPAGGLPIVDDPGAPLPASAGARVPDPGQERVIAAPPGARRVVEAGPGFGKTDVACARVVWLVEQQGVEPESILLLSFTRTAVREMRARIRQLVTSGKEVGGVEVRTLDSFSWRLRAGSSEVTPDGSRRMSYEESITALLRALENPSDDIVHYIERFEHVFIDEAQDLTGRRAELVARLLALIRKGAGYTLFLDPAQAIYGWEEEAEQEKGWDFNNLLAALNPAPERVQLSQLHRTRDPELRKLLLGARRLVLDEREPARDQRLRSALMERAERGRLSMEKLVDVVKALGSGEDTFVLFRTRVEALEASSWLVDKHKMGHRLRLGKLPQVAAPWIAVAVNALYQRVRRPHIFRDDLEQVWSELGGQRCARGWGAEQAWRILRKMGAVRGQASMVSLSRVADRLAMWQLPDELFLKDIGPGGPVIGTIHSSKGREASTVLMTFRTVARAQPERALYEARVLYVALSRARERLLVWQLSKGNWSYLESGRAWQSVYKEGRGRVLRLEVGYEGDVDVTRAMEVLDAAAIRRQQDWLARFEGSARDLVGIAERDDDWCWHLRDARNHETGGPVVVGVLSKDFKRQVWDCIHELESKSGGSMRPDGPLKFLRCYDVTTVAVSRDYKLPVGMPEPWRSTRIWLAPVVSGLGWIQLKKR